MVARGPRASSASSENPTVGVGVPGLSSGSNLLRGVGDQGLVGVAPQLLPLEGGGQEGHCKEELGIHGSSS